jgi:hypothetical protein
MQSTLINSTGLRSQGRHRDSQNKRAEYPAREKSGKSVNGEFALDSKGGI